MRFSPGQWRIRYAVNDAALAPSAAAEHVEESYLRFSQLHLEALGHLCTIASDIYSTSVSNVRSGCDYALQERKVEHIEDIAVRRVVRQLGLVFQGEKLIRIGRHSREFGWLSAGKVPFCRPDWIMQPALNGWWEIDSVECFWQSNRIIEVNRE
jgi:hypothetical protein